MGEIRSLDPELQKGNIYLSGILASSVTLVPSLQRELLDSEAQCPGCRSLDKSKRNSAVQASRQSLSSSQPSAEQI